MAQMAKGNRLAKQDKMVAKRMRNSDGDGHSNHSGKKKHKGYQPETSEMIDEVGFNGGNSFGIIGTVARPEYRLSRQKQYNIKTAMLCEQVRKALDSAVMSHQAMHGFYISEVVPDPSPNRLLAKITPLDKDADCSLQNITLMLDHLHQAKHHLKEAIGSSTSRKRIPSLDFVITPAREMGVGLQSA